MMRNILLMCLLMGVLTSCISGRPDTDTYTDKSGKTTIIETDQEQCKRSCNDAYSVCMESQAARTNPVDGSPPGMFGGSSDCRTDLSSCLPSCRAR